ncbi:MAG: tRNA (adenosine(37)-N6)-threonylcarbamoyltransferase complex transferase subunit TsaD, partial [Candidatus Pacebacteria bacterium]|nr:tRNA (adenosine(37)-N6)-threonylcarbamoyltransferase complex transferase subunit TsaD [Candidatus Paceibacterota bacterium]
FCNMIIYMKILAIETSCDDTGVAVLEKKKKIKVLSDFLSCQNDIHSEYGGVNPSIAKREHAKNIFPVFFSSLKKAKLLKKGKTEINPEIDNILERYPELLEELKTFFSQYKKPDIDQIAVTAGPGLEPCLWVGINFAKALSLAWNVPLLEVNHIEAHILVNFIKENRKEVFPALSFVISGGNTKLFLMQKLGIYKEIGSTRDDAIGECFDKTARMLKLPYPGGIEISKRAKKVKKSRFKLPRPMIRSHDYDFSFSGLKTAVLYEIKDRKIDEKEINELCFEIEEAVKDVIVSKIEKAILEFNPKSLFIGGGVSANKKIQQELKKLTKKHKLQFFAPKYTTDNAVMIGVTALLSPKKENYDKIKANSNLNLND